MHHAGTPEPLRALVWPAVADEDVAADSAARLLITGATQRGVEALARRIHDAGRRAQFPFVHMRARKLPIDPESLKEHCSRVLEEAAGGSMLISDVEDMPPVVQERLIDFLAELELASRPSVSVRFVFGTTVSLLERVAAGTFSARLFYLVNIIHVVAGDGPVEAARV